MGVDYYPVAGYGITLDVESVEEAIQKYIGEKEFEEKYYGSITELFWCIKPKHALILPEGFHFNEFGSRCYGGDMGIAILSDEDNFSRDFTPLFDWAKKFDIKSEQDKPYLVKEIKVS